MLQGTFTKFMRVINSVYIIFSHDAVTRDGAVLIIYTRHIRKVRLQKSKNEYLLIKLI